MYIYYTIYILYTYPNPEELLNKRYELVSKCDKRTSFY